MAFPRNLDFDLLILWVLDDIGNAISGWLQGQPRDETAFLNRITAELQKRHRGCNVGVKSPLIVYPQLAILHRQGPRQTDRYGADLAVTLFTPSSRFSKTVFFQLKKSRDYELTLDRSQIEEALVDPRVGERSFILAVDENQQRVRIEKVSKLIRDFSAGSASHTCDCDTWTGFTHWFWNWLSCEQAPSSDTQSPDCVERLLENFAVHHRADHSWERNPRYDLPENFLPARVWTEFALVQAEFEEPLFGPPDTNKFKY